MSTKKKKKSWFSLVKRIFVSDKKKKWVFGGFKVKKLPAAPTPQKKPSEAEENKPALTMKVNEITEPVHQVEAITESSSSSSCISTVSTEESAATRIQTAFRGYLARKALEALKGIVRLQALIRGRAVRKQSFATLKCLQSIMNIQTQACARRFQTLNHSNLQMDLGSERRWDDSILSKKNSETLTLSKKEAAIKRERMKEYSFLHRKSAESERKVNGRLKYWLEQWVDTQLSKSREFEDLDTIRSTRRYSEEFGGTQTQHFRFSKNPTQVFDMNMNMNMNSPRRSSQQRRQQDKSNPSSPTYMAATQSARAKTRSVSTPKRRVCDTCSECYSPYKNKLSYVTSSRPGAGGYYQQNSPSFMAFPASVKSSRMGKDLSFDSDCSIPNWYRQLR